MGITFFLVLTAPLLFPYNKWNLTEVFNKPNDIIQINATVIAGILLFLTLSVVQNSNTPLHSTANPNPNTPNVQIKVWNRVIQFHMASLIATLTALTVIPFASSSILAIVWGNNACFTRSNPTSKPSRFLSKTIQETRNDLGQEFAGEHITGLKVGGAFTIAGFAWLIISMILFVTVIYV
jgi:hypothetical protein